MAKQGRAKNTRNKELHTKLLNRKKNNVRDAKKATKERLKDIIKKHQEQAAL